MNKNKKTYKKQNLISFLKLLLMRQAKALNNIKRIFLYLIVILIYISIDRIIYLFIRTHVISLVS